MNSFVLALNATVPIFLIIALGFFLQRVGFLNDGFNKTANELVFRCALPVSLFRSIAGMDFYSAFDPTFCLFCFCVTTVMFFAIWGLSSRLLKDKGQVGAFSQAAARSSAAVLGIALAENIYGSAGMVPMMIMSSVPFFNVYSVLILSFSPKVDWEGHLLPPAGGLGAVKRACVNVITNPLILGILAGLPFSLLRLSVPTILDSALSSIGATATPLALLVVGASFSGKEAMTRWKGAAAASAIKLLILPALVLPLAALLGFRQSEMVAILIMVGSPTTVACYVMARNMQADSVLTSNTILISTALSSVTITLWLYLMLQMGWI